MLFFFFNYKICHHSLPEELKTFVFASTVNFKKLLLGKGVFQIRHQNPERKIWHFWSPVTGKNYGRWGSSALRVLPKRLSLPSLKLATILNNPSNTNVLKVEQILWVSDTVKPILGQGYELDNLLKVLHALLSITEHHRNQKVRFNSLWHTLGQTRCS